ncbi:hypothetical protein CK203_103915 [Vitis vinifera]|uniref:Uncharacterized protein n=1 Tax=Vitis vinifera TaxID=29760 RepID=A0A438CTR6_VITVI|nr:hypothetical protein CK203_103915 [Vitis vinifera]
MSGAAPAINGISQFWWCKRKNNVTGDTNSAVKLEVSNEEESVGSLKKQNKIMGILDEQNTDAAENILRGLVGKGLMVRYRGKRGLKEELLTVSSRGEEHPSDCLFNKLMAFSSFVGMAMVGFEKKIISLSVALFVKESKTRREEVLATLSGLCEDKAPRLDGFTMLLAKVRANKLKKWWVLDKIGFGDKWVKWIKWCIFMVKFSILVNGVLFNFPRALGDEASKWEEEAVKE